MTNDPVSDIILTSKYLIWKYKMPTHYPGKPTETRTLDTFIKLTRCNNSVLTYLSERNTLDDLTPSQFAVLEALYHLGAMNLGEISAKVLKSGSNLTTVVDNLERDGLVRRERSTADRRVIHIHITDPGRRKIETVLPVHVAALVEAFSVLNPEEQETLGRLCKKLGKGVQTA